MSHFRITALVLVAALMGTSTASAQDADPADAFYVQAVELLNQGKYIAAIEQFDRAIELRQDPIFFCNRATAQLKLKEFRGGLESLRTCRTIYDATADPAEVAQLDAEISGLAAVLEGVGASAIAVASSVSAPDGPVVPPTIIIQSSNDALIYTGWASLGVGMLSLGGALALDLLTQSTIDDFEAEAAAGEDRGRYAALQTTIDDRKLVIAGLTTLGAISLGAAGVIYWLQADTAPAPSVGVAPTPGGGLVVFSGGF